MKREPLPEAILRRMGLPDESGCMPWLGNISVKGYGRLNRDGRMRLAHRLTYAMFVGPLDPELTLDHLCRNRRCVAPGHLEQVSLRENVMRSPIAPSAVNARKVTCPQGHELSGANLYINPAGGRVCRSCSATRKASDGRRHHRLVTA